jgi:glycosyltransferase involved in cell wall biosynthesis
MKILQLANKLPYPPKDGGSIATFSLGRSFAELGHEVTILAMNTSKHYYDLAGLPQEVSDLLTMEGVDLDTRIRVPDALANLLFSSKPYNATRFVSNDYAGKLEDMLKTNDYDIIQLEGLYLSYYLPLIRTHSNALVSMRAHNVEHEIWERSITRKSGFKRWYIGHLAGRIKKMEVGFLNDYDVIAPITARDADRFKHLGCRLDMHVVPTGIDAGKFDTDRSGIEYPSLFHIGALDWLPNQEGLMWFLDKAWDALHDRYPDMKLYLAGRNAPDFIRKINLPNVVFLGEVDDAYDFMRSKAIMIVPLLSGSGMRIKIIEGMALGKAIVSTNIGTEGIPTTDGLDIMVANTASGFIDSISSLVNNQELFERIGKNAITFVTENFDNRTIASSLLKFYEDRLR